MNIREHASADTTRIKRKKSASIKRTKLNSKYTYSGTNSQSKISVGKVVNKIPGAKIKKKSGMSRSVINKSRQSTIKTENADLKQDIIASFGQQVPPPKAPLKAPMVCTYVNPYTNQDCSSFDLHSPIG
jgi:hypothetical protein